MITTNNLHDAYNNASTKAEQNAQRKRWDIFRIATASTNKKRISEKTFNEAKKVYNAYKKLNRYNDRLLELDNDERLYNKPFVKRLHDEADQHEIKTKQLLKRFNLGIEYYGPYATITNLKDKNNNIHLNYCL